MLKVRFPRHGPNGTVLAVVLLTWGRARSGKYARESQTLDVTSSAVDRSGQKFTLMRSPRLTVCNFFPDLRAQSLVRHRQHLVAGFGRISTETLKLHSRGLEG